MLVTVAAMLRKKSRVHGNLIQNAIATKRFCVAGKTSMYLYADPVLVQRASLEQQQLEQVTALAVLHDQGLVCLVLKDPIQLC